MKRHRFRTEPKEMPFPVYSNYRIANIELLSSVIHNSNKLKQDKI